MTTAPLPGALAARLRRLRDLTRLAEDGEQRSRAYVGASQLILALYAAGWPYSVIARSQGLTTQAVSMAAAKARAAGVTDGGLEVEGPAEADWLSRADAARLVGVHPYTLSEWQKRGLLPRTRHPKHGHTAFARADLEAVLAQRDSRRRLRAQTPNE